MDELGWYALAGAIILLWIVVMYYLFVKWSGKSRLTDRGFSLYGPFVMWRTKKGRAILDRISKARRFWEVYGDVSIALAALAALVMLGMLLWQAYLVPSIPREAAPKPELMLGLPGINKFIPLWYGIFGLAIAIIVHEGAHGILMRAGGFQLKSLGLLFFIFPMGAFAEQDDKELAEGARRKRMRVFAAGPAANLVVAFVCVIVFSMVMAPAVHERHPGVGIVTVGSDSPAERSNLTSGMIIYRFNGTWVNTSAEFTNALALTRANQTVPLWIFVDGQERTYSVTLGDRGMEYSDAASQGKGYMGINSVSVSTQRFHPIAGAKNLDELVQNGLIFITLPISGISPVQGTIMNFYTVDGMDAGTFWLIANAVYWVFWLNLMVGLTNVLPAIPLDGGFIFKDWIEKLMQKMGVKGGNREEQVKLADKIVLASSVLMLCLIIWPLIGPRIL